MSEQQPRIELSNIIESDKKAEKEKIWADKMERVNKVVDGLGLGIDEEIKEPVVAFNVMGLPTFQSCGGHTEEVQKGAPWVWVEAPDEPETKYNNENEILQKVADGLGISINELKTDPKYLQKWIETDTLLEASGQTEEWRAWIAENERLHKKANEFLDEFYKNRDAEPAVRLITEDAAGWNTFRVHNGGDDFTRKNELTEDQKKDLAVRLEKFRDEMTAFGKFLKDKFFSD